MAASIWSLPPEVVAMICESCTSVGDVKNLLQTCKTLNTPDMKAWVFGRLLGRDFDADERLGELSPEVQKEIYLKYKYMLERGSAAQARQHSPLRSRQYAVGVVRDMIVGAWSARRRAVGGNQPGFSKNLQWFEDFGNGPKLFSSCSPAGAHSRYPDRSPEVVILQVALSHLRFQPGFGRQLAMSYFHQTSREEVYCAPVMMPMFDAGSKRHNTHGVQSGRSTCLRVEPGILLHIVNLWHHHLSDQTTPMGNIYWSLAPGLRISGWTERLKAAAVSVKSHYLGFSCSAEDDLQELREYVTPYYTVPIPRHRQPPQRPHVHGDERKLRDSRDDPTLEDMHITSYDLPLNEDSSTFWPNWLERATRVYTNSFSWDLDFLDEQLRMYRRLMIASAPEVPQDVRFREFTGYGRDGTCNFLVLGIVTPMNNQYGVPGFQRFIMAKIYLSLSDSNDLGDPYPPRMDVHTALDNETLDKYAYEGVVLPGGRMIFGRWFRLNRHTENGEGVTLVQDQRDYFDHSRFRAFNLAREHKKVESGPFIYWAPRASQNIFPEAETIRICHVRAIIRENPQSSSSIEPSWPLSRHDTKVPSKAPNTQCTSSRRIARSVSNHPCS